ncbi:hypothetical protein P4V43_22890 [Brevibacillus fortis]|uniref:hypothetical protein n=1 Tax=Brevibacillus fortis TaxID=2126352 RepID=UPI002E24AB99|nr:hypothetical protein [Brevibacillus fortis]
MGEARRRKQAGSTEPNPNYTRAKRLRRSDIDRATADFLPIINSGLLVSSLLRKEYPKWK